MEAVFDGKTLEEHLIEQSREAIRRFATEYPDVTCSFFAYNVNPIYGEFLVSFDIAAPALEQVRENEQEAMKSRNQMLTLPEAWRLLRTKGENAELLINRLVGCGHQHPSSRSGAEALGQTTCPHWSVCAQVRCSLL